MVKNSQPKFQSVYDYLVRGIESGFYRPETRFPSERKLAEKLNVNVATVRRAFRDLITSGVVEKRVGDGTYLTRGGGTANGAEYVNIVLSNYQGDTQDEIAELALEEGARRNLRCRIVRLGSEEMAMFVRTAIRFRQPTMVLGDDLLTAATIRDIAGNAWLFAVLANRLDQLGIPSVIGDDHHGIRLLTDRLHSLGHRRIALLHNNSGHPIENIQIAVWRSVTGGGSPELRADVPTGAHPTAYAFQAVGRAVARGERFSALITLNDELAQGALAAFSENGVRVPEQMSLISIGDSLFSRYSVPPLTALNPNLAEHIRQGFELLARTRLHSGAPELLRLVAPALVIRKSDSAVPSVTTQPRETTVS